MGSLPSPQAHALVYFQRPAGTCTVAHAPRLPPCLCLVTAGRPPCEPAAQAVHPTRQRRWPPAAHSWRACWHRSEHRGHHQRQRAGKRHACSSVAADACPLTSCTRARTSRFGLDLDCAWAPFVLAGQPACRHRRRSSSSSSRTEHTSTSTGSPAAKSTHRRGCGGGGAGRAGHHAAWFQPGAPQHRCSCCQVCADRGCWERRRCPARCCQQARQRRVEQQCPTWPGGLAAAGHQCSRPLCSLQAAGPSCSPQATGPGCSPQATGPGSAIQAACYDRPCTAAATARATLLTAGAD